MVKGSGSCGGGELGAPWAAAAASRRDDDRPYKGRGKGGGKPDLAMAGGSKPELLDQAFNDCLTKIKKIILN